MTATLLTPELRAKLIKLSDAHAEADEFQQSFGYEWKGGACSIGCTIYDAVLAGILPEGTKPNNHAAVAKLYGLPLQVVHLFDAIFENLPNAAAVRWTSRWQRALRDGADYSLVWPRLALWLLRDSGLLAITNGNRAAVSGVIDLYARWCDGNKPSNEEWSSAAAEAVRSAAWSAAEAARSAAWSAVETARYAARSAEETAAEAVRSAAEAARSAVSAPRSSAAWSAAWGKIADKLIELLDEEQGT
jgi:hypothetical protein